MKNLLPLLMLTMLIFNASGALAEETGAITGKAQIAAGSPLANGVVYFFSDASGPPPSMDAYWRVPDEIVSTDAEGNFTANLVSGKYYVGAIKREKGGAGQEIGPPRDGDLILPINSDQGKPQPVSVVGGKTTELGVVSGAYTFRKKSVTAIEGRVTDAQGKPVENALVFAFVTPAMVGKPLFVSERTDRDGTYTLKVHQGGEYYLKVRDEYGGGALKAGDILGSYGQEKPLAVTAKSGKTVHGVDITGIRFPGYGPKKQ